MNIEIIYEKLITDISIISLQQLGKVFGFGSKKRIKMTNELYSKYTKEHILSITRPRMASHAAKKQWENRTRIMPEEIKQKISEANKRAWVEDNGCRKEISRKIMIRNAANVDKKKASQKAILTRRKRDKWAEYSQESYKSLVEKNKNKIISSETRKKQSISATKRGRTLPIGFKHSQKTKNTLSKKIKELWKSNYYKRIYKSKISTQLIEKLIKLGYNVETEYFIDGKPFDIKIGNCIIEFNGTYWHYDSRKYDSKFYDKIRKCYAHEVWEYDRKKIQLAEQNGFKTYIVWQLDWETTPDEVIENVTRFIENI